MAGALYRGGVIRLLGHAERLNWLSTDAATYAALSKSAYTPTYTDTNYTTIAGAMESTNDAGSGYTAKGKTFAPVNPAYELDTYNYIKCDGADPAAWTSSSFTTNGACIWNDTATNDPLFCWTDFGADKTVVAGTLTVQWDAKGIFRIKI